MYGQGKKYLLVMDRLIFRSVKSFLDYLVTKFGLPTKVKLEACLVLQS